MVKWGYSANDAMWQQLMHLFRASVASPLPTVSQKATDRDDASVRVSWALLAPYPC